MQYEEGISYIEFIDRIIEDSGGKIEYGIHGKSSDGENKSKRAKLKKIFKALEMEDVLENERYKSKNDKRVKAFPVHFQILCYAFLKQEDLNNEKFIKKIKNGRFEKITENEINLFCEQIEEEFDNWLNSFKYTPMDKNERSRKELDEEFLKIEEEMIEAESVEIIYLLKPNEEFTKNEIQYLKKKARIKMEKNIFIKDVKDKIFFKGVMKKQIKEIHDLVDEKLNRLLGLNEAGGKITILTDYESELLDDIIPMPIEYTQNPDGLINRDKCEILADIKKAGFKSLDLYEEYINAYIEEKREVNGFDFGKIRYKEQLLMAARIYEEFLDSMSEFQ